MKRAFDIGDYTEVRRILTTPNGQFAAGANPDAGEMFYMIASSSPSISFDADLDLITHALDLNAPPVAVRNTPADRLWGMIKDNIAPGEEREPLIADLVLGLLHLNNFAAAGPQHQDRKVGKDLLDACIKQNSKHALYWRGYLDKNGLGLIIPVDVLASIRLFSRARAHTQALRELSNMGALVSCSTSNTDEVIQMDGADMAIGPAPRLRFMQNIVIPDYEKNMKEFACWSRAWFKCANVWEGGSLVLAGTSTVLAFATTKNGDLTLALVSGILGTAGVVLKGIAHYSSQKARENSQHLNQVLRDLHIHPNPQLSEAANQSNV